MPITNHKLKLIAISYVRSENEKIRLPHPQSILDNIVQVVHM